MTHITIRSRTPVPPRADAFGAAFRSAGRDRLASPPSQGEPVFSFPRPAPQAPTTVAAIGLAFAILAGLSLLIA
jgi:hypothetical protein